MMAIKSFNKGMKSFMTNSSAQASIIESFHKMNKSILTARCAPLLEWFNFQTTINQ